MNELIGHLRTKLASIEDEALRKDGLKFFKEPIQLYGIKTSEVIKMAKESFNAISYLSKAETFELCETLWRSGMQEEGYIACEWAYALRKQYVPDDFDRFEKWVGNYVSNWATCDTLCNHTIGTLVEMFPEKLNDLKRWATSENRWLRRASAVTLIIPARNGLFLNDIFEIADLLLLDTDDMVQKGYGWMLKAATKSYPDEVFKFVVGRKAVMPRTALRYAIEKLPEEKRKEAMAK
jgi:3-methyladenine DNA glycosylase AlkD